MMRFMLAFLLLAACAPASDPAADEREIRRVIADMETAWNRGDFRGYMQGFKYPDVVFVSRGRFQRDWQGTLDHYVRDYGGDPARRHRNVGRRLHAHHTASRASPRPRAMSRNTSSRFVRP